MDRDGQKTRWATRFAEPAAVAAVGLTVLAIYYRSFILTGFDVLPGDLVDVRLLLAILEHWYNVFRGAAPWLQLGFFYPVQNTLGYTDALFLEEVPYVLLRSAGADMFLASQMMLMMFSALGFLGMFRLLRAVLNCRLVVALAGTTVFALSNALHVHGVHYQLYAIQLAPFLFIAILRIARPSKDQRHARLASWLAAAGLLAGLLYSSFYIAWGVTAYWSVLAVLALSALLIRRGARETGTNLGQAVRRHRSAIAISGSAFVVLNIPFAITYLPVMREFGARPFEQVLSMLPGPLDFANVSSANWIWGRALSWARPGLDARILPHEHWYGFPPGLLIAFGLSVIFAWRAFRISRPGASSTSDSWPINPGWSLLLAGTVFSLWVLMLRVGDFTLWKLIYGLAPGGNTFRAASRLQLVLAIPTICTVAVAAESLFRRRAADWSPRSPAVWALALVALFLAAEQIDLSPLGTRSKREEIAVLDAIRPPDARCKVFYLDTEPALIAESRRPWREFQTEAMMISLHVGLPTINGRSGQIAHDWRLYEPFPPDAYRNAVADWLARNHIESGVCALDLGRGTWRLHS